MRARLDRGDQRFLPLQALDLPGAEREQRDEGEAAEKRDEPRKAAVEPEPTASAHRSSRPSSALLAYCSVMSTPLMSLSDGRQSTSVSGIQSRKCSQSGGP